MNTNTNGTLELFQLTKPESIMDNVNLLTTAKRSDSGAMRVTLSLAKRKDIAENLNLKGKDNSAALMERILGLSDSLKAASVGEFVKLAASPEWTGGRFQLSQSKNGKKRATISIVSADRTSNVTPEAVVKALAAMPEEQREALLEKLKAVVEANPEVGKLPAADVLAEITE